MKPLKFLFYLIIPVFFVACGDDDDGSPSLGRSELLIGKSWEITALTADPAIPNPFGPAITDLLTFLEDCDKDDLLIFESGGKGITDEGPTKCDPADPQQEESTWSLNSDETVLTTVVDGDEQNITIVSLTETTFVGTFTDDTEFPGITVTITLTAQP